LKTDDSSYKSDDAEDDKVHIGIQTTLHRPFVAQWLSGKLYSAL